LCDELIPVHKQQKSVNGNPVCCSALSNPRGGSVSMFKFIVRTTRYALATLAAVGFGINPN
jgi:hypothetical protein